MKTGWVYIMVNDSMPGFVKVGYTSGTPQERAAEICGTGVPMPFIVVTAFLFADNARNIEQLSHSFLNQYRASANREFFKCSPEKAAFAIVNAADKINEEILKNTPKLLSSEEILRNRKLEKEQEQKFKELTRPCRRLHWTQIYSPYLDFEHRDQSKFGHKPYVQHWHGKILTLIIHNFSDCDCSTCKQENVFLFKNPRDPKQIPGSFIDDLQYASFKSKEKYLCMERYRLCVPEEVYLSKNELKIVNYRESCIIYGVYWGSFEGNWVSSTRGFIVRIRQEKIFNCKIDAIRHFKSNHYEDPSFPSEISLCICPCERCKNNYIKEQERTNMEKNKNFR
jgi:hypothetical protein